MPIHPVQSGKALTFEHFWVAKAFVDSRAGGDRLAAGDRISAIIGGVISAWTVIAGQADASERRVRRRSVGRFVPVDDPGADAGPEAVVKRRIAADQARRQPEARVVGLSYGGVEILDPDDLQ